MKYLKRCKKPLSLLLIVSLILSLVPVVPINIAKADNYDSIRDGIYSGGSNFDIYKGVSRNECLINYGLDPNKQASIRTTDGKTLYLNVEATIDRKQAIYGTPEDVPGNFVSYQAGFKAVSNGYFYATQTNGVWHLSTSGTRGYFRYIGYDVNGNVISDQQFPADVAGGYIPVSASTQLVNEPWNNATAKQICSVANGYRQPDSSIYHQAFLNKDSLLDEKRQSLGQALSIMGKTKADFINSAMILNPSGTKYVAQVVLVLIDNGVMHYRSYTGPINKAKPQLKSDSITTGIDSQSYLLNAGTDSYKYNPTTQKDPSFTVTITGTMTDYYNSKTNDGGYYKAFNYTREDVTKYTTIINYVKVNGNDVSVVKEYVDAISKNSFDIRDDSVTFSTTNPSQLRVTIPKDMLKQGTNTITMAGKTRVYFDNGQWADAGNSASKTITVINDYKPATPTLKLNVTPTPTEVSISNGTYNPTNIQHNIGATVSVGNVPPSYKIGDMEFKIDTSNNVDSTIPISKAINNTSPNNTLNNITYFNFDTTKITKKSTPAYYGKVRYSLVNTSNPSEVWWSNWSSLASTNAEVNLKIAQGDLTGTLSNNDKIALDSNGNVKGTSSKNFTASFTVTGSLSDTGNKTIKNWSVIIYHTNGTESQTYTISSTSKSIIASNKQLVITTDKNKSAENFVADVIVNFTDNTNKKVQTNPVSIPVEIEGDSNITLNFSGSKRTLSGKVGDTVSVTLYADSKVTTTKNVTNYSIWIRKSDESLSSPTNSTTSNIKNLSASKPYSYKLTKDMNNTTVSFIARAKATLNDGTILDSGQKTFTVTFIVSDNPPPVSDNPPSSVNCNGFISPTSASATKNPFTGVIDPPTTSVQVGVSASVDAGSKTVSRWELYCDNDLLTTINGNNTSVSAPLGEKSYTVSNDGTRTFNFKAKVYFTDGSSLEGTDTKVFGATQQELPNNPPSVNIVAFPQVINQGDDSSIRVWATDPDIINGDYLTVTTTIDNTDGVIGNIPGDAFFDKVGSYNITATARDSQGLSATSNKVISVVPTYPQIRLRTYGTYKEFRKVTIDASATWGGSKRATINWNTAQWTITPSDSVIIDWNSSSQDKINCLFTKEGNYNITLKVANNYGNYSSYTTTINIKKDYEPIANFVMPTIVLRDPANNNQATINVKSLSYSPDNDIINKHYWLYCYDSNNDGNFTNEQWYIYDKNNNWVIINDFSKIYNNQIEVGNQDSVNINTSNVGKYKIMLVVQEEFGQETIPQYISFVNKKMNQLDTMLDSSTNIINVINTSPYATLGNNKYDRKKVTINVVSNLNSSKMTQIISKLNNIKSELYSYGVNVNYITSNSGEAIGQTTMTVSATDSKSASVTYSYSSSSSIPSSISYTTADGYSGTLYASGSPTYTTSSQQVFAGYSTSTTTATNTKVYQYPNFSSPYINSYSPDYNTFTTGPSVPSGGSKSYSDTTSSNTSYDQYGTPMVRTDITTRVWTVTTPQYTTVTTTTWYQTFTGTVTKTISTTKQVNIYGMDTKIIKNILNNSENYLIFITDSSSSTITENFEDYFPFANLNNSLLQYIVQTNSKVYVDVPASTFDLKVTNYGNQNITLRQLAKLNNGILIDSAGNATAQLDQLLNDIKAKYTNNTPKNEVYVLADEQQVQYYPYQDDYEDDFIFNQRWKYKHITVDNVQNQSVFTNNAESNDIGQLYGSTYGPPGTLEIDTTNKYEGNSSAKVYTQYNYTGGMFIKSPAIQVGQGFNFTITAYVKYTSGKQINLTVIVGDSSGGEWFNLQSKTITANGSWQQISITATNNISDYIKVLISYSNATPYEYGWVDAISVIRSGSVPIFDNPNGTLPQNDTWLNSPIDTFSYVGKYLVTYQVQDSPPPMDDSNFDEYRQWSKLEDQLTIYVHRRPIADFTAIKNASNKLVITDRSYDLDHQYNRADKGIINRKWQYKTLDDTNWTDTTLSNLQSMTLQSGKIYLIKLEVQDCDGINGVGEWSKPNIQLVDTTVANNPPVAQFDIQNQVQQGTQPVMTDNSFDPDGDTITSWHWWIYNSDNTVNKDFGEVGNNNISNVKSYIATLGVGNYIAKLQVKDSAGNYSAIASKNFTVYTDTQQPEATNNAPTGTFTMTINDFRTKLKPTTTYTDPDSDPKNAEQWYIKFNGQTKYYNNLPNTLEEAGYIYDGQYEIGYRVQDNPITRSSKLTPLWSNWYTQVYNLSSTITINAWTEKIAKRAHRKSEVDLTTKKTSTVLIGEGIVVKAKTTGYVYKIDAWFDRVDTVVYTPNRTPVTKTIVGYWECNIKAKTIAESMVLTNIHTKLDPAKSFTQPPNSMDWSSDVYDRKLQVRFIINHDNSFVRNNDYSEGLGWGDQAKNLWEGVYCWSDWNLTQYPTFNKDKAMAMYGRVPYFKIGDKLWIKVRAYKKNADGTDTTKDVDLPITINGSLVIQAGF